jgi:hypothetical protein
MNRFSDRRVFNSIIVFDGQVIGIWKRTVTKENMTMEIHRFKHANLPLPGFIYRAASLYGRFMSKQIIIRI